VKAEVATELPKKTVVIYHGMSALQKKYYKTMLMKDLNNQQTFVYLESKQACDFHARKYFIILLICIRRMQGTILWSGQLQ
jgi:hypothetical protein